MLRRALGPAIAISLAVATAAIASPAPSFSAVKWPAWLSIESPVNPYDSATRGALFLVHGALRDGTPSASDISGSAEGLVNGTRRTIALHFDATTRPGVFAVRKQWPNEGTWVVRITLAATSALVSIDRAGNVASARVPTQLSSGMQIPRAILAREIDSLLADASRR